MHSPAPDEASDSTPRFETTLEASAHTDVAVCVPEIGATDLPDGPELATDQELRETVGDQGFELYEAEALAPEIVDLETEPGCVHPEVAQDCSGGWCRIPAGCFVMGSPPDEAPWAKGEEQHQVTLTRAFEILQTELTFAMYQAVMDYTPGAFVQCGDDCPANLVSWHEALFYCNLLSAAGGLPACFECTGALPDVYCALKPGYEKPQDCPGYRLPTEAEWEYAARAGTTTAFHSGDMTVPEGWELDANLAQIGWYFANGQVSYQGCSDLSWKVEDNFEWMFTCMGTNPVGSKKGNGWGLLDVSGNVYEWVWDWYEEYGGDAVDPAGPPVGPGRIVRGGSWYG